MPVPILEIEHPGDVVLPEAAQQPGHQFRPAAGDELENRGHSHPLSQLGWFCQRQLWPHKPADHVCSEQAAASGLWNSQIPADLANQQILDFCVARNGTAPVHAGVMPPGMASALTQQFTAVLPQMAKQIPALQRVKASSS